MRPYPSTQELLLLLMNSPSRPTRKTRGSWRRFLPPVSWRRRGGSLNWALPDHSRSVGCCGEANPCDRVFVVRIHSPFYELRGQFEKDFNEVRGSQPGPV